MIQTADAAARYNSARAGSQHTSFFDGPAIVDGLSRSHLDARIDFGQRETDIKKIYSGSPDAESLLDKYGVDYVVIDPQEISVMGTVNTASSVVTGSYQNR